MRSVALAAVTLVTVAAMGCGGGGQPDLQIYDSNDEVETRLDIDDVVGSSAQSSLAPDGRAVLYFELTQKGAEKFQRLTRALARRGASLDRAQSFVFEIDDRIYARPVVDYRTFPDGLDGDAGLQIGGLRAEVAQRLAAEIRGT